MPEVNSTEKGRDTDSAPRPRSAVLGVRARPSSSTSVGEIQIELLTCKACVKLGRPEPDSAGRVVDVRRALGTPVSSYATGNVVHAECSLPTELQPSSVTRHPADSKWGEFRCRE